MKNNILQLKGEFTQKSSEGQPGATNLPKNGLVNVTHVGQLQKQLEELKKFWMKESYLSGALISVHYIDVIAKSRRIKSLLSKGNKKSNDTMVGAKFSEGQPKHIITHYIPLEFIDDSIQKL